MRLVTILGSTGSIGTQALDVVRRHPERFRVVGLSAGGMNQELLVGQIREFLPPSVAIASSWNEGCPSSVTRSGSSVVRMVSGTARASVTSTDVRRVSTCTSPPGSWIDSEPPDPVTRTGPRGATSRISSFCVAISMASVAFAIRACPLRDAIRVPRVPSKLASEFCRATSIEVECPMNSVPLR